MSGDRKTRDSRPEAFRLLLMWMVVFWHLIGHGVVGFEGSRLLGAATTLTHVAVPCFILISGWYGIRPGARGLLRIVSLCVFYSLLAWGIGLFAGTAAFSWRGLFSAATPFYHGRWWFMNLYLALYATAPLIDSFLEKATARSAWLMAAGLYAISAWLGPKGVYDAKAIPLFWFLYMLGRLLRAHCDRGQIRAIAGKAIGAYLILALLTVACAGMPFYAMIFFAYNGPVLILSAAALSLFFLSSGERPWKSPAVNSLAAGVLPCYLIHENEFISPLLAARFGEFCAGHALSALMWGSLFAALAVAGWCIADMPRRLAAGKIESIVLK